MIGVIPTEPDEESLTQPLNLRVTPALEKEIKILARKSPGLKKAQVARTLMSEGLQYLELKRRFPAQMQAVIQLQQ